MVRNKSESSMPAHCDVRLELDNKALRTKNFTLTQTVAKLQEENTNLSKQVGSLQRESFEINSKYNNLKNVVSIIDGTMKSCLPKFNEVVNIFTSLIQLCSVAANISNTNRDTRTQTVKPQIVNGHVLHNPTITLSRLEGSDISHTPPRLRNSNVTVRQSPGRSPNGADNDRLDIDNQTDNSDESEEIPVNEDEHNDSIRCQASNGYYNPRSAGEDSEDSSDEEEIPTSATSKEDSDESKLSVIHELEEEEEDFGSPCSPRTRHRRAMKAKLQEVRIYLNQLPNSYVEKVLGPGNISISLTPPDRRSSFKHRSSSLVGETDKTLLDESRMMVDDLNRTIVSQREVSIERGQSSVTVSFNCPTSSAIETMRNCTENSMMQYSHSLLNKSDAVPSTSRFSDNSLEESKILTKGSPIMTPIVSSNGSTPSDETFTPTGSKITIRKYSKSSSIGSTRGNKSPLYNSRISPRKSNVTTRKRSSKEDKIAQVVLKRLTVDRKLRSADSLAELKDIVNTPPIRRSSQITRGSRSGSIKSKENEASLQADQAKVETPTTEQSNQKTSTESEQRTSNKPEKRPSPKRSSTGRPKRAARPKVLREPSLVKKLRRSK